MYVEIKIEYIDVYDVIYDINIFVRYTLWRIDFRSQDKHK